MRNFMKEVMKKWKWKLLILLYLCFIYGNSLTPAVISSKESGYFLIRIQSLLSGAGMGCLVADGASGTEGRSFYRVCRLGIFAGNEYRCWNGACIFSYQDLESKFHSSVLSAFY